MNGMDGCVFSSRVLELKSVTIDICADICSSLSDALGVTSAAVVYLITKIRTFSVHI